MANNELSKPNQNSLVPFLDRAEVLAGTVAQLRKDLSLSDAELPLPVESDKVFDELRTGVIPVLVDLDKQSRSALQVAMYRVDISEVHFKRTLADGGLHALAGECVVRALQKVLTRARYAGRF